MNTKVWRFLMVLILSSFSKQISAQSMTITTNDTVVNFPYITVDTFDKYIESNDSKFVRKKYLHNKDSICSFNKIIRENIIGKLPDNWNEIMFPKDKYFKEPSAIMNVRYKIEIRQFFRKRIIYIGNNHSIRPHLKDMHIIFINGRYYLTSTYCYERICAYLKIKM